MNKSLLYLILSSCLFLHGGALIAEWDPQEELSKYDLQPLHDTQFVQLKNKITSYLSNSWCSPEKINVLMDVILITQPKKCVEIGVFTGSSLLPIAATLQYLKKGKVFAIDAWSNAKATENLDRSDPKYKWWSQADMKAAFSKCSEMIKEWRLRKVCTILHESSQEAAGKIENNIDFLHFDGGFSEKTSLQDVLLYIPKVREGGYILLSNTLYTINGRHTKKKAFSHLFSMCDLICEIDGENTFLFRKK